MSGTATTYCARCLALRWVEEWRETPPEMLWIVLGPCGHVIQRSARLEWTPRAREADDAWR